MTASRIELFKQMLTGDPGNTSVLFGLAKEYEKAGLDADLIEILQRYLEVSDDEGNALGMLAAAYERTGQRESAATSIGISQRRGGCDFPQAESPRVPLIHRQVNITSALMRVEE